MTDGELLRSYARDRSESSFEELVRRHIDLVYAAALRQVNGDTHQAGDVTQSVFTDPARKAAKLAGHPSLAGWLYTSTRFLAANARRAELRRHVREQEAHAMNAILQSHDPEPDWTQVRPLLDEAMHTLDEPDREAVLLRHFEGRSYAEIGNQLGLTEGAARMRVERSLDKLQAALAKHGVTSTAVALAALLAVNAAAAAPATLAASVARTALAGAAAGGGLLMVLTRFAAAWKVKLAVAAVIVVSVVTSLVVSRHSTTNDFKEVGVIPSVADTNATGGIAPATVPPVTPAAAAATPALTNGSVLHLEIVAADSGKPVPLVQVYYAVRRIEGDRYLPRSIQVLMANQLTANRQGRCDIFYLSNAPMLEIALRLDDFADTRLSWCPDHGEVIPTNYVARLDRAESISGRVLDTDGNPVAGAEVMWGGQPDPAVIRLPQYHEIGFAGLGSPGVPFSNDLGVHLRTDQEGRWQVSRIAADMLPQCMGVARHTNYVPTEIVFVRQEPGAEKELRDGTFVFRLKRAVTAAGMVVAPDGTPVSEAKVTVGKAGNFSRPEGRTQNDGSFFIAGCEPGRQWMTAEAEGYMPTSQEAEIGPSAEPVRLILQRGKVLRLRIVDKTGKPIRQASALQDVFSPPRLGPVETSFQGHADVEGHIVWTNAPDAELLFNITAFHYRSLSGVKFHPDGEEHVVTLAPELVVRGKVRDQSSGQPVPKFRIVQGWLNDNYPGGTTNVLWNSTKDFWSNFADGSYELPLIQPLVFDGNTIARDEKTRDFLLKFEAEGYATCVSRIIAADEGVELDIAMRPAKSIAVTVYKPDRLLACNTDVGLVFPSVHFLLTQTGLSPEGNADAGNSLLRTDAKGQFVLPADDTIGRIIAASPEGYAEATPAALCDNPVLQLQPWGRLEITCLAGTQPAAGREYQLDFSGGAFDTISFEPKIKVKTDAQGQFLLSQMPPGRHQLTRSQSGQFFTFEKWSPVDEATFEIRSGETTALTLGSNSLTVSARLHWPAGIQHQPQWNMYAYLETPMPQPPPEIRTNEPALTAFYQSAEFQTAARNQREYPLVLKDTETLIAKEVQPGNYELVVMFGETAINQTTPRQLDLKHVVQAKVLVTVPADVSTGTFDASVIELKPISR